MLILYLFKILLIHRSSYLDSLIMNAFNLFIRYHKNTSILKINLLNKYP